VRVDDEVFNAAHEHFGDREIVEVILTVGFYMMMARLTEAVGVELDAAGGMALYQVGKNRGKKT
jgi:alkylhydroperoxidase family enzyme